MTEAPTAQLRYAIDDRDVILSVSEGWVEFARANNAAHLTPATVLGHPLWNFIADRTTRHVCRRIIERARGGRPVEFSFRCDAPGCRRLLTMQVTGGAGGHVEFHTRTLSEESRPGQRLLAHDATRSDARVRMCSWCNRVFVGRGWTELEEAARAAELTDEVTVPRLTHGICEECYATMAVALAT